MTFGLRPPFCSRCGHSRWHHTGFRQPGCTYLGACKCQSFTQDKKEAEVSEFNITTASTAVRKGLLTGRKAECVYCHQSTPSAIELPFFEYLGLRSRELYQHCENCGYYDTAHMPTNPITNKPRGIKNVCHNFRPTAPKQTDRYYCGCRGWD